PQDAVSMRTANHPGVGLAGLVQVVGVAALAAEQYRVFGALHRLADAVAARVRSDFASIDYCRLKIGDAPPFLCRSRPWPPISSAASRRSSPTRSTARSGRRSRTSLPTSRSAAMPP